MRKYKADTRSKLSRLRKRTDFLAEKNRDEHIARKFIAFRPLGFAVADWAILLTGLALATVLLWSISGSR